MQLSPALMDRLPDCGLQHDPVLLYELFISRWHSMLVCQPSGGPQKPGKVLKCEVDLGLGRSQKHSLNASSGSIPVHHIAWCFTQLILIMFRQGQAVR